MMDVRLESDDPMLKGAVMSASMAMAITDPHQPDNPIVFVNPAFSKLTGYDLRECVGRNCRFLQGAKTDPASVSAIRRALAERAEIQVDVLNYRKNGSPFTNRLFISPVLDGNGDLVHYFASQLDATELLRDDSIKRRRETILRYLAGELNQRLNSTLSVVQTIVRSTLLSASSVVEASEAISARLVSLGQVHRQMSANDWEDEDVETLVRQVVDPFRAQFAGVTIEGPSVRLDPLLGLKMASAVYELLVDAAAAPAGTRRTLRIGWAIAQDGTARRLRFEWEERGAPSPVRERKTKLHHALSTVMKDAGADVALRCEGGGGLACRIEVGLG